MICQMCSVFVVLRKCKQEEVGQLGMSLLLEHDGTIDGVSVKYAFLGTPSEETFKWHLRRILPPLGFKETKWQPYKVLIKDTWKQWCSALESLGLLPTEHCGRSRTALKQGFFTE
eukprot:202975-Amphidinium_carterae.1